MESIQKTAQSAVNYVSETLNSATATTSKEANKEQAKNENAGIGERISAAGSALSDKADEQSAEAKKENAKQSM